MVFGVDIAPAVSPVNTLGAPIAPAVSGGIALGTSISGWATGTYSGIIQPLATAQTRGTALRSRTDKRYDSQSAHR